MIHKADGNGQMTQRSPHSRPPDAKPRPTPAVETGAGGIDPVASERFIESVLAVAQRRSAAAAAKRKAAETEVVSHAGNAGAPGQPRAADVPQARASTAASPTAVASVRPRPMPRAAALPDRDRTAHEPKSTTSDRLDREAVSERTPHEGPMGPVIDVRETEAGPRPDTITVVEWTGEHVAAPNATYTRHRSLRRRWREYWIARSVASGRRRAERDARRLEKRRAARRA